MKFLILALFLLASAPVVSAVAEPSAVLVNEKKPAKKQLSTVKFKTTMHCKNCVRKISENISFEKGVEDLQVSLDDKLVTIKYNPSKTDEAKLADAIRKLGYEVEKVK